MAGFPDGLEIPQSTLVPSASRTLYRNPSYHFFRMIRAVDGGCPIQGMNMSDSEKPKTAPADGNAKGDAPCSATCCTLLDQAEAFARREPTKAVASAFGAGFLLHLLPIGAILRALAAVAFALARPALLFLGLQKVWDICPCKKEPKA